MSRRRQELRRLEESREKFEARLLEVRQALGSELGIATRPRTGWVLPLVGVGLGMLLAWKVLGRRRRSPKGAGSGAGSTSGQGAGPDAGG